LIRRHGGLGPCLLEIALDGLDALTRNSKKLSDFVTAQVLAVVFMFGIGNFPKDAFQVCVTIAIHAQWHCQSNQVFRESFRMDRPR